MLKSVGKVCSLSWNSIFKTCGRCYSRHEYPDSLLCTSNIYRSVLTSTWHAYHNMHVKTCKQWPWSVCRSQYVLQVRVCAAGHRSMQKLVYISKLYTMAWLLQLWQTKFLRNQFSYNISSQRERQTTHKAMYRHYSIVKHAQSISRNNVGCPFSALWRYYLMCDCPKSVNTESEPYWYM